MSSASPPKSGRASPKNPAPAESSPGPRPDRRRNDRKQQILLAARDLFVRRGFHNVTMADIAASVGITAGGLYKHFSNKADVLVEVFAENFTFLDEPPAGSDYGTVVDDALAMLMGRPYISDLWIHELRHLPPDVSAALRSRMVRWNQAMVPAVRVQRPGLDSGQEELLTWAMQSLMAAVGRGALNAPMTLRQEGMRAGLWAILDAPLVPTGDRRVPPVPVLVPQSTRERLLLAAQEQFSERGYQDASLITLGQAANVTGTNLYGHFASKADLLRAVIDRGVQNLWHGLDEIVTTADSAETALRGLVRSYAVLSKDWISTLEDRTSEPSVLMDYRAEQREYIAEWVALLPQVAPALDERRARIRVQLTLFLIADLQRNHRVSRSTSFVDNVSSLATTVLLSTATPASIR